MLNVDSSGHVRANMQTHTAPASCVVQSNVHSVAHISVQFPVNMRLSGLPSDVYVCAHEHVAFAFLVSVTPLNCCHYRRNGNEAFPGGH